MKTIGNFILCSCFFLSSLASLQAQMLDGGTRFGIKLGVNGANLYDDKNASDKKSRIGVTGGAFVQIPLAKGRMSLRPELLFTTKGAAYDYLQDDRPEIKINYIELPVSLEYRLIGFLNLHAGAYASLLAGADGDIEGLSINFVRENFEDIDYGWHAGTGIDLGNLGLHFRISRGLQKVGKQNASEWLGDLKNASWSLALSYGF